MRKAVWMGLLVPLCLALMIGTAYAGVGQTSGQGLTQKANTLGFNAKSDLTGEMTYVTHDGSGLMIKCDDYNSYRFAYTAAGYLRTRVTATCFDQDGTTVYVKVYFIDKGEPGLNDKVLYYASYDAQYRHNAELDPNALVDTGIITDGNVQILI